MQCVQIRAEKPGDEDTIHSVTVDAFEKMPFSQGDEQNVIDRLRSANALTLSFVALIEEQIVGHVAFSPAQVSDTSEPWFALGPVSVLPEYQRQGIGSAMIEKGIQALKNQGALGCILTGNPRYYQRFGFKVSPQHAPETEPAEYFMLMLFSQEKPTGRFRFHDAFYQAG